MLKAGLKAVESISKAVKSKWATDILKAGSDTAKVVDKATRGQHRIRIIKHVKDLGLNV